MERIKLELVPGCVKPILRASQYDNGREWTCDILDNGVPYKFVSGDTCEIHVRKGDNCAVTASVPVTVGQSYVVVTSTEQMCAVSGDNLAELVIMNGTKKIGSCNLILSVEADPLNGSKSSASEIHDLQAQVNDCVDEALSHKGASDIAFDNTDTGLEATNVQDAIEEVNTKTDAKADADSVYDKTYMDGIFEQIDNAFTNVDNTKMNKANPTGTGSFSMNRKSGTTVGQYSHAEGYNCEASGQASHAEGLLTKSTGYQASHAEGAATTASGTLSHAEGFSSTASGEVSHAEGHDTTASGMYSHSEGDSTEASGECQHVFGKYNIIDRNNEFVEVVGNGPVGLWNERSNARTLDWNGNEWLAGDLTYNGNKSITSEVARLDSRIDALPDAMIFKGTLGVGGTITELPTASASNEGWTYKVITAGTYEGQYADIGDCFTCYEASENVFSWTISSKGDTDTDTWRNIKVNGVEKLGNGISSGSLDVVDTDNIEAEFDNDGNKLKLKTRNIYTQSEVDTLIANAVDSVLPTDSVSKSAVATFETDLAKPIDLKAYIEATQDLHGEANPYPAGGGVNQWNGEWEVGGIDSQTGQNATANDQWRTVGYVAVLPSTEYYICTPTGVDNMSIRPRFYDADKNYIGYTVASGSGTTNRKFTTPANCYFMRFSPTAENVSNHDISLNYPSSDTAYHPYSNICPIGGWSEVNLYQLGGNLFDKNTLAETGKLINGSGNEISYTDWNISDFIPVIEGASYYFYGITTHPNTNQDNFELFDENKNKVGFANVKTNEQPYLIPSGVAYIKCTVKNPDLNTAQFGVSVNTSYVPYTPIINTVTIDLDGTRYGGYVTQDKLGHRQLVVTHAKKKASDFSWYRGNMNSANTGRQFYVYFNNYPDYNNFKEMLCDSLLKNNTTNWNALNLYEFTAASSNYYVICVEDYASSAAMLADYGNMEFTVILRNPFTIDLPDGEPISALIGTNNLFADSGDIECSFKCGVALYVDNHSGGGNRGLAKSGGDESEEEVKDEPKEEKIDEPLTRQER